MAVPPPGAGSGAGRFGPELYADWHRSSLGEITDTLEHRLILELLAPLAGLSVLDVGCGDGTLLELFRASGADRVAGCDPDPSMVARARDRLGGCVTVGAGQALPFPDASFDRVTCVTVLAFVPDAPAVVREMARVLRPGGTLLIGDLGRWSLWAARRRIRGWLGHRLWRGARFRTAGTLAGMLRDAGLTVTASRGAIFFPPWTPAARAMAPMDHWLGKRMTVGAAFVVVSGR